MSEFYSQGGEDQFLLKKFVSKPTGIAKTYLEIGAVDGVKHSNTKYFEDNLGWTGVLVEPNPVAFESLRKNRPNNVLLNSLVSTATSPLEFLYFENENLAPVSCISATMTDRNKTQFYQNEAEWLVKAREKNLKKAQLDPVTMDSVIASSGLKEIGICIVDVEGHELEVLRSFSFSTEISVFMIDKSPHDKEISKLLKKRGYEFYGEPANNNVFVSSSFIEEVGTKKAEMKEPA